jgi:ubiquinone biosynthesis protein UbiJ
MFEPLITRILNHLVNQNEWAREQLQPYSGKAVLFIIPPLRSRLIVLEDGGLAAAGEAAEAVAKVTLPLPVAMRLLAGDANADTLVTVEGDTELALALSRVLRNMSWEYEEDLSRLVGDAPAHQLAEFGRKAVSEVRKQSLNIADMFAEYWQEEQPLLAKKRHVNRFMQEVADLRDEVERLEKRLDKLAAAGTTSTSGTIKKDQ